MTGLIIILSFYVTPAGALTTEPVPVEASVCFSPDGNCVEDIIAAIDNARFDVQVQAMNFSLQRLADALIRAHQRGVRVEVILAAKHQLRVDAEDFCTSNGVRKMIALRLSRAGIPIWIDAAAKTAHNKITVIDGELVIGGSYNYTISAENANAENVTFIKSNEFAGLFQENWDRRKNTSNSFIPRDCMKRKKG